MFQNVRLTEVVDEALSRAGLTVLVHHTLPPNDGGISIGQAAIAARSTHLTARRLHGVSRSAPVGVPKCGGAAPRPMPQLVPPSRPSSSRSGGRCAVARRPAGRRRPRPGSTARQGARKAHHAQCVHAGVGSNETAGSSIARTAAPRRAAALRFSVVV